MAALEESSSDDLVIWEGAPDPEYDPEAPYGRKADGTPAKKRGRPKGSTNTGSTTRKGRSKSSLEQEILEALQVDLAPSIGALAPLVAYVIDDRAERTARALGSIANRSPNFKRGLEKALVYRDFVTLASLPPAIAVAFAVEFGVVKYDSMMSRRFNLYSAYIEMYGDEGSETMPDYRVPNAIGILADNG